jgi:hypothetical protein
MLFLDNFDDHFQDAYTKMDSRKRSMTINSSYFQQDLSGSIQKLTASFETISGAVTKISQNQQRMYVLSALPLLEYSPPLPL